MRLLLLPFAWIYAAVTALRNLLFDKGFIKTETYKIPVISVGNITVGGTGKTPLSEYIIRKLSCEANCALISRGYGRKTKGVILADEISTHEEIGDEPMQILSKFDNISVVVAEKRTEGFDFLFKLRHPPDVVVMDDAFQHRYIKSGLSILLIDYTRPIWKDFVIPAGNLRESKKNIYRADIVIVNKCPRDLSEQEADKIKTKLKLKEHQTLFFTTLYYDEPIQLYDMNYDSFAYFCEDKNCPVVAMAGIGNPVPFFRKAKNIAKIYRTVSFRDHYRYNIKDINKIFIHSIKKNDFVLPAVLTTEKDAVKLRAIPELTKTMASFFWYIPIEIDFLFDSDTLFNKLINDYVRKN
jgi:tetraacyldisaccharide 4'-kinase